MTAMEKPPHYSEKDYEVRPAVNHAETNRIWMDFILYNGWDRGPDDLATYLDHSRSRGMILAFRRGNNRPVGMIATVVNDNNTGWVALFIVDKDYQGLGVGAALWSHMEQDLHNVGIVGLDGVPQQKATYERRGFVDSELGVVRVMSRPLRAAYTELAVPNAIVVDIGEVSASLLAQFELRCTGFLRPKMWENLLARKDVLGFVQLRTSSVESVEDIVAVSLVRRCPGGARLGPIYAETADAATLMTSKAIEAITPDWIKNNSLDRTEMSSWSIDEIIEKAGISVEVWGGNPEAIAVFEKLGWQDLAYYHRMWLNDKAPPAQSEGGMAQTGVFALFDAAAG